MWINPITRQTFKTHSDIRSAFSDISFPVTLTEENIISVGLLLVHQTQKPEGYIVEEAEPIQIDNTWTQRWVTRPPTEAETAAKAAEIRRERDAKLLASDWIVARSYEQGIPVPETWVAYRQALRDITQQPGFPWEVVWPTL